MQYSAEEQAAIEAVRTAARACQAVRRRLVSPETLEKKDKSPVTVADFASQAVVCGRLKGAFPGDPVVAEEDAADLREGGQSGVRRTVVEQVAVALGRNVSEGEVLGWIDHGGGGRGNGGVPRRFWTLDPIDGTKGFLRGEQYAVAVALVEDGRVVLGALGCPNLALDGVAGALLVASRGQGARILPLVEASEAASPCVVSPVRDPARARFCESVESAHSDQDGSARVARALGITMPALRMDSQVKYAIVARGDAQVYLRLPTRADYQERIWDHAAGAIVVEEAGGRVSDVEGRPLDFSRGPTLSANRGVVATNGHVHDAVIKAIRG